MSAAVMSPLGTMSSAENEEYREDALFHESTTNDAPMKEQDDESVPDLSEDIFTDFEMEFDTKDADIEPAAVFGGLNNLGNTCYLNSAMQMLASLDHLRLEESPEQESSLRKEFLNVFERLQRGETVNPAEFKSAVDARSPLFIGYRQQDSHEFLTTLLDLLDADYKKMTKEDENMETTEEAQGEKESEKVKEDSNDENELPVNELPAADVADEEIAPAMPARHPLFNLLPSRPLSELQNDDICQLLHGGASTSQVELPKEDTTMVLQCKLVGGRAAVPMSCVTQLTSMNAPEDELAAAVPDSTQQEEAGPSEEDREPTPIEEYFTTEIRAQLTCDSCKYTRCHVEKYLHLSLDIGSDSGSVEEGLRKFFAPEHREIKCEKCFCETATQTMEISKLPRALLVHCKRFIVDVSPDYSSITYRKNQSPFSFSDTLSASPDGILGEFLAADVDVAEREEARWSIHDADDEMGVAEPSYGIRSVVNHIGSSASCGHYTCDASRLYPNGERQWTRFNDAWVSNVSTDDATGASAQRTAYMVMYELE